MSNVTHLLEEIRQGDPGAKDALLALVYAELRRLARAKMAQEQPGHTLQPTALVHEAWMRLGEVGSFENRAHFFSAASEAMRRILVDAARRKMRVKHGGHLDRVDVDEVEIQMLAPEEELIALDEALTRFSSIDARAAEVVKLCFFVGLTQEQAARELSISLSTVERLWSFARAWLYREIERMRSGLA